MYRNILVVICKKAAVQTREAIATIVHALRLHGSFAFCFSNNCILMLAWTLNTGVVIWVPLGKRKRFVLCHFEVRFQQNVYNDLVTEFNPLALELDI